MSKFNVGDRVWSAINGWGIVERVATSKNCPQPILVRFDNNVTETFNSDGKYYTTSPVPVLFHDEVKDWPNPPKPFDWNKVPVDTPVFVRDTNYVEKWIPRHFAKFEDGFFYCYNDGKTSFTEKATTAWRYCKINDEL